MHHLFRLLIDRGLEGDAIHLLGQSLIFPLSQLHILLFLPVLVPLIELLLRALFGVLLVPGMDLRVEGRLRVLFAINGFLELFAVSIFTSKDLVSSLVERLLLPGELPRDPAYLRVVIPFEVLFLLTLELHNCYLLLGLEALLMQSREVLLLSLFARPSLPIRLIITSPVILLFL